MEDFILREIDKIGVMLAKIAQKLGLLEVDSPDYSLADVKEECDKVNLPFDLDEVLQQENPVCFLVEDKKISDQGLETFMEILFFSDMDEERKRVLLADTLTYLDAKGFYSFRLHSLSSE